MDEDEPMIDYPELPLVSAASQKPMAQTPSSRFPMVSPQVRTRSMVKLGQFFEHRSKAKKLGVNDIMLAKQL